MRLSGLPPHWQAERRQERQKASLEAELLLALSRSSTGQRSGGDAWPLTMREAVRLVNSSRSFQGGLHRRLGRA